jgi:hypothetical protein
MSNHLKLTSMLGFIEDSTGLKVYGQDEWHQEKHTVQAKRTWGKLPIAIDEKHQVLACDLTTKEVGDPSALPALLKQVDAFDTFMAVGAYDTEPSYQQIKQKSPDATCIIPPPKNAVKGDNPERNQHIEDTQNHGRMGWQQKTNYGLRSHVELAMLRYKIIIGNTLKARHLPHQISEAQTCVKFNACHLLEGFDGYFTKNNRVNRIAWLFIAKLRAVRI